MGKKTIILTERQLEEIATGVNMAYLDGIGSTPDMGDVFSTEVSPQGSSGGETYADPETTDDFAVMQSKDWPRDSRSFGKDGNAPANIREMSKKDWENKYVFNEQNSRLENLNFYGNTYAGAKQQRYRVKKATEMAQSDNQIEAQKGRKSLQTMINNRGEDFGKQERLLSNAEQADQTIQSNRPEGTKIKSAPKVTGNEKSHGKNGFITPSLNN